jgi:LacI family transcriptional regulator
MAVRMKDIADELGISIVTVSKVFNNHRDISPATRRRVLQRMKELNYQPSLHAQGLASGHTFMVGLIVPDLVHAFFSEVAKSISNVLRKEGFGLVIASSDEDPELEKQEIEQMMRRRVDVLMVASCQSDAQSLQRVAEQKVPLILLDRNFDGFEANFVGTDDVLVGEIATEHLISIGRRKIAHIGGQTVSTSKGRLQGYKKALARHRIVVPDEYIISRKRADESGDTTGHQAMEKLLRLKRRPDAVFCVNDPAAIGAMNAILAAGLRIPEDIAIIGSGNIRYADSFKVPLSSVDVFNAALGEHAGTLALQLTKKKNPARHKAILVRPKLVMRESTGLSAQNTKGQKGGQVSPRTKF